MAKLIDKEPKYEGEKNVWHAFSNNLPEDWVVWQALYPAVPVVM